LLPPRGEGGVPPLKKLLRNSFYYFFPLLPLPDKVTTCALLVALSVRVKVPLVCPGMVGEDETLIAHEL
jgi:hypothetical protein